VSVVPVGVLGWCVSLRELGAPGRTTLDRTGRDVTPLDLTVLAIALAAVAWVLWYFLGSGSGSAPPDAEGPP
jgi:hypothetical protein